MRKALSHVKGIREEMMLLGLRPKNHVLDQKKYIKHLEIKNKFEQEERERVNPAGKNKHNPTYFTLYFRCIQDETIRKRQKPNWTSKITFGIKVL